MLNRSEIDSSDYVELESFGPFSHATIFPAAGHYKVMVYDSSNYPSRMCIGGLTWNELLYMSSHETFDDVFMNALIWVGQSRKDATLLALGNDAVSLMRLFRALGMSVRDALLLTIDYA